MNFNRREFLQAVGFSSAFAAAGCKCPFCGSGRPVALQLWSINKIMWKTMPPEEVFAKLREIGFDGVEFAGFGGRSAKEIRKLLKDAGLRGMGSHMSGIANFSGDKLKENLDFCAEAGIESFTNAWEKCETADAWKKFGTDMGKAAETAQAWKLPVSFHNHCHEFTMKYDGVCAWDLVFRNSSPLLLQQLDSGQVVNPRRALASETFGALRVTRRASTRLIRSADARVLKAIDFIRRRACEGLTPPEVVVAMGCSRRLADLRFREVTGHTILDEIHEVRLSRVKELLARPRQSVSAIPGLCGYASIVDLRRVFKQRIGMTMREWQQKTVA